jgi:predicted nucleic acid-binding protein
VLENIKPIIEKLQATNFRISENILEELLGKNNELGKDK